MMFRISPHAQPASHPSWGMATPVSLNYPDSTTCALAAAHTGKPYTWITPTSQPLYWIYGGAGLEGDRPMIQRGSQQYKCARCHTTGWTANHAADDITLKHPQSDYPSVDFKNL